ncbi:hypothetical protein DFJ73DRAFT_66176 [Zopfochytrium polystomum]|nr:hypothetical protein DFJ73DRAFT_66176 [Zopfochytrium polystomum]
MPPEDVDLATGAAAPATTAARAAAATTNTPTTTDFPTATATPLSSSLSSSSSSSATSTRTSSSNNDANTRSAFRGLADCGRTGPAPSISHRSALANTLSQNLLNPNTSTATATITQSYSWPTSPSPPTVRGLLSCQILHAIAQGFLNLIDADRVDPGLLFGAASACKTWDAALRPILWRHIRVDPIHFVRFVDALEIVASRADLERWGRQRYKRFARRERAASQVGTADNSLERPPSKFTPLILPVVTLFEKSVHFRPNVPAQLLLDSVRIVTPIGPPRFSFSMQRTHASEVATMLHHLRGLQIFEACQAGMSEPALAAMCRLSELRKLLLSRPQIMAIVQHVQTNKFSLDGLDESSGEDGEGGAVRRRRPGIGLSDCSTAGEAVSLLFPKLEQVAFQLRPMNAHHTGHTGAQPGLQPAHDSYAVLPHEHEANFVVEILSHCRFSLRHVVVNLRGHTQESVAKILAALPPQLRLVDLSIRIADIPDLPSPAEFENVMAVASALYASKYPNGGTPSAFPHRVLGPVQVIIRTDEQGVNLDIPEINVVGEDEDTEGGEDRTRNPFLLRRPTTAVTDALRRHRSQLRAGLRRLRAWFPGMSSLAVWQDVPDEHAAADVGLGGGGLCDSHFLSWIVDDAVPDVSSTLAPGSGSGLKHLRADFADTLTVRGWLAFFQGRGQDLEGLSGHMGLTTFESMIEAVRICGAHMAAKLRTDAMAAASAASRKGKTWASSFLSSSSTLSVPGRSPAFSMGGPPVPVPHVPVPHPFAMGMGEWLRMVDFDLLVPVGMQLRRWEDAVSRFTELLVGVEDLGLAISFEESYDNDESEWEGGEAEAEATESSSPMRQRRRSTPPTSAINVVQVMESIGISSDVPRISVQGDERFGEFGESDFHRQLESPGGISDTSSNPASGNGGETDEDQSGSGSSSRRRARRGRTARRSRRSPRVPTHHTHGAIPSVGTQSDELVSNNSLVRGDGSSSYLDPSATDVLSTEVGYIIGYTHGPIERRQREFEQLQRVIAAARQPEHDSTQANARQNSMGPRTNHLRINAQDQLAEGHLRSHQHTHHDHHHAHALHAHNPPTVHPHHPNHRSSSPDEDPDHRFRRRCLTHLLLCIARAQRLQRKYCAASAPAAATSSPPPARQLRWVRITDPPLLRYCRETTLLAFFSRFGMGDMIRVFEFRVDEGDVAMVAAKRRLELNAAGCYVKFTPPRGWRWRF